MLLNKMKQFFTDCADAIRYKRGFSKDMRPDEMPNYIKGIQVEPPTDAGEYHHIVENAGTDSSVLKGVMLFGSMPPSRFASNSTIEEIVCLDDVPSIPSNFAKNTTNLKKVELQGHINSIGASAFDGSTVEKIILPDGRVNVLPDGVTVIPDYCFQNCKSIYPGLTLHDNVDTISQYAFNFTNNYLGLSISNTKLPANLTTIGSQAFCGQQLPITEIPQKVQSIGTMAFAKNSSLTSITFKGTPGTIGSNAFSNCSNLVTINVPWAEGAISGAPWGATNATINYNHT